MVGRGTCVLMADFESSTLGVPLKELNHRLPLKPFEAMAALACTKCGSLAHDGVVTGGANPCHLRNPPEDHSFSQHMQRPLPMTRTEWFDSVRKNCRKDEGDHLVGCYACPGDWIRGKKADHGAWFEAHMQEKHPYPFG